MNKTLAVGIVTLVAGLFSSAASAQSTTYFNIPQAFGTATQGPVSQSQSAPGPFESSWLHLRESHGVGIPGAKDSNVASVEHCNTYRVAQYESSWLNLIESQRGQNPVPGGTLTAAVNNAKC